MNKIYVLVTSFVFIGLLSPLLTLSASAQQPSSIIISEMAWGGSVRNSADEWLELANLGATPIDLSGWSITGAGTSGGTIILPQGSTIPAYGTFLISNYSPSDSSTITVLADYVTTAVSLPNSKLVLSLIDTDSIIVDTVNDAGTPDYGSTTPIFSSMERNLTTLAWQTASISQNLLDQTQLGSPGIAIIPIEPDPVLYPPTIDEPNTDLQAIAEITTESVVAEPVPTEITPTPDFILDDTYIPAPAPVVIIEPSIILDPIVAEPTTPPEQVDNPTEITAPQTETLTPTVIVEQPEVISPVSTDSIPSISPAVPNIVIESTPEPTSTAINGRIIINEFLSAPNADYDEWIEIYNIDAFPININGWNIVDASGKITSLSGELAAGSYQLILNPLGKLNNDGDTITLLNSNSQIVDAVSYGTADLKAPKYDESISRISNNWVITQSTTPGTANIEYSLTTVAENIISDTATTITDETVTIVPVAATPIVTNQVAPVVAAATTSKSVAKTNTDTVKVAVKETTPTTKSTVKPTTAVTVTTKPTTKVAAKTTTKKVAKPAQKITSLTGIADSTLVSYQSTVIALPGTFGKQIAVLNGAMLYMNSSAWPALATGDIISVTGITSTANGEQRIKLTGSSAITIIGHEELVPSTTMTALPPSLVTLHGEVATRNGSTLTIKVDGQDVIVEASKTSGIIWSTLTSSTLTITGVLRHINGEDVLMPRNLADVAVDEPVIISSTTSAAHSSFPIKPVAGGGLATGTLGALGYWFIKSKTLIPTA